MLISGCCFISARFAFRDNSSVYSFLILLYAYTSNASLANLLNNFMIFTDAVCQYSCNYVKMWTIFKWRIVLKVVDTMKSSSLSRAWRLEAAGLRPSSLAEGKMYKVSITMVTLERSRQT